MPAHRLSKSRFIKGLKCNRRLWMVANRPDEAREDTPAERHRMAVGTRFGQQVAAMFPGGVEIEADYRHPEEALAQTSALLRGTAPALFEPAFLHHDVLIRADVLERSESDAGSWRLIEVKSSSNSASGRRTHLDEYVSDIAVQVYVLEGAGISVESASLAWVDSGYERDGDLDWRQLVAFEDLTGAVRDRVAGIGAAVQGMLELIDDPDRPDATFGKTKCDACEFDVACWGDEPADSIIHLPRVSSAQLLDARDRGIRTIPEIPSDFHLTPSQHPAVEALSHPNGHVAEPGELAEWLGALRYPLYFFDFEAWSPCIPPFDRTHPYQQIPFQYSIHLQHEPSAEPSHREFLAGAPGDPRPELIERMLEDLGREGSIVVHHAQFETKRIEELAEFSPAHRGGLLALLDRIVDTEVPFKNNWYLHPDLMGRSSIKVVLPALVPGFGYEELQIADGLAAAIAYEDLRSGAAPPAEVERVRQSLLEYCRMDTLAMVKIVERLLAR